MKKRILCGILLICTWFVFSACNVQPATPTHDPDKLLIVTTNFPPYDFARQITGEDAEVIMLLSPGEESHSFEPTPKDIMTLAEADLFILGGGESDAWAKKLMDSAELDASKAFMMMDYVDMHAEDADEKHDHSAHYAYDEHVWTSPRNATIICTKLSERLAEIDAENAENYRQNFADYLQELALLDAEFTKITTGAARKTIVFADRFPFRHLADTYGLSYYSAFPGCSAETEPDAATMSFLIDTVKKEQIPAVFYTEHSDRKIADAVTEATGAKQLLMHSCHTLTKEESERGETYISIMKQNAEALKEALS